MKDVFIFFLQSSWKEMIFQKPIASVASWTTFRIAKMNSLEFLEKKAQTNSLFARQKSGDS